MTPDVSDSMDRLDQSVSSIDISTTALAVHEEKECDVSGVGKLGEQNFLPTSQFSYTLAKRVIDCLLVFPVQKSWRTACFHFQQITRLSPQS